MNKKEKNNIVKILGLVLDKNNNLYMEIEDGKYYEYIPTNINIRDIFKEAIVHILDDFKVAFKAEELEFFLDVLIQSTEYDLPITELYRGLIDVEIDDYLKMKFDTKSSKKHFRKIDKGILQNFLETDFKRIAVKYITLHENMYFIKYYIVILDKTIILRKNGQRVCLKRVNRI